LAKLSGPEVSAMGAVPAGQAALSIPDAPRTMPAPDVSRGLGGQPRAWLGVGLVLLATMAWSTAGLFVTTIVRGSGISSLGLAFWRVFCTFLCLSLALLVVKPGLLRVARRDLPWLIGMGALAVGTFQFLWVAGIMANGMSLATVIQCNAPVIVTILAWVFWREPLTWHKWVAIGLALAGTLLIARPNSSAALQVTATGLLISVGSALAYASMTLFSKKLSGRCNPWTILVYSFGFASLALLPFQIGRPLPQQVSAQVWLALGGLVLITTITGYMLYMLGLKRLQASVASILAVTEVPFAAFLGYVFLAERLDVWQILGALTVVSGVMLVSWGARSAPRAVVQPQAVLVNPIDRTGSVSEPGP
jgi:drug/metabolite transporter (DMT)-like permease